MESPSSSPPPEKNPFASSHWRKRADANRRIIPVTGPVLSALGVSVATEITLLQYLFPQQLACVASRDAVCLVDPSYAFGTEEFLEEDQQQQQNVLVPATKEDLKQQQHHERTISNTSSLNNNNTTTTLSGKKKKPPINIIKVVKKSPSQTEANQINNNYPTMMIKPKIIRSVSGGASDIVGVVPCIGNSLLVARSGGVERLRATTLLPYYTSDDFYYHNDDDDDESGSDSDDGEDSSKNNNNYFNATTNAPSTSSPVTAGTPSVVGAHLICIASDPWVGQTIACGCADGSILSWSILNPTSSSSTSRKGKGRKKFSIVANDNDNNNNGDIDNNNSVSDTISYMVHRDWVTGVSFVKTDLGMIILISISDDGTVCTSDPLTGIVLSTIHGPDLYPPYALNNNQQQGTTVRLKRNPAKAISVLDKQFAVAWENLEGRILSISCDGKILLPTTATNSSRGNSQQATSSATTATPGSIRYNYRSPPLVEDDETRKMSRQNTQEQQQEEIVEHFKTPAIASALTLTKDFLICACEDEAVSIIRRKDKNKNEVNDDIEETNLPILAKCAAHKKSRFCCGSFMSTISGLYVPNAAQINSSSSSCFVTWSVSSDGELVQWIVPPPLVKMSKEKKKNNQGKIGSRTLNCEEDDANQEEISSSRSPEHEEIVPLINNNKNSNNNHHERTLSTESNHSTSTTSSSTTTIASASATTTTAVRATYGFVKNLAAAAVSKVLPRSVSSMMGKNNNNKSEEEENRTNSSNSTSPVSPETTTTTNQPNTISPASSVDTTTTTTPPSTKAGSLFSTTTTNTHQQQQQQHVRTNSTTSTSSNTNIKTNQNYHQRQSSGAGMMLIEGLSSLVGMKRSNSEMNKNNNNTKQDNDDEKDESEEDDKYYDYDDEEMLARQNGVVRTFALPIGELVSICPVNL